MLHSSIIEHDSLKRTSVTKLTNKNTTCSLYTSIHSIHAHHFIHPHPVYTPASTLYMHTTLYTHIQSIHHQHPAYTRASTRTPIYLLFGQVGVHVAVPFVRHRFRSEGWQTSPLHAAVTLHPVPCDVPETVQQP